MKKSLLAAGLALAALGLVPAASLAATETVVVTPDDTQGWVNLDTRPPGFYEFVDGPGTPPLGTGSLHLVTPDNASKASLANGNGAGTLLSTVDAMAYSTYRSSASTSTPIQLPSYQLGVDSNGAAAGGFTTLVFEPVYNLDQGPIVSDAWQDWDAFAGGSARWWSTRAINGQCAGAAIVCQRTWSQIVANNPDATLSYLSINQGSGNPGLDANVDAYTFGAAGDGTTYDFELTPPPPTSTDQCKKGGWQTFGTFKNQGDCVSFVATRGKNGPNG